MGISYTPTSGTVPAVIQVSNFMLYDNHEKVFWNVHELDTPYGLNELQSRLSVTSISSNTPAVSSSKSIAESTDLALTSRGATITGTIHANAQSRIGKIIDGLVETDLDFRFSSPRMAVGSFFIVDLSDVLQIDYVYLYHLATRLSNGWGTAYNFKITASDTDSSVAFGSDVLFEGNIAVSANVETTVLTEITTDTTGNIREDKIRVPSGNYRVPTSGVRFVWDGWNFYKYHSRCYVGI